MSYRKKTLVFIACLCCSAILLSCGTNQLMTVEKGFMLEPGKSIAVVSGYNDDNSINLAEMISERLTEEGRFKVLSQSEISHKIPKYPLNISLIDFSIPEKDQMRYTSFLTKTSKDKIDAFQKVVNTDYVLVVWVDGIVSNNSGCKISVISRLIAYPEGNIVSFSNSWNDKYKSCLGGNVWVNVFNNATKDYVDEIIDITKKQVNKND